MKFFRSSQANQAQPDHDPVQSFAPKPKGQGFYNDRKAMENFERQRRASIEMHRQAPHLHPNTMVRRRQDHRTRIMRVKGRHHRGVVSSHTKSSERRTTTPSLEKRTPPPVSAVTSASTERTDKTSIMSLSVSATSSSEVGVAQPSADWDDSAMPQFETASSSKRQFDSFNGANAPNGFQQSFNHDMAGVQERFDQVEIKEDLNGNVEGHMGQMGAKLELEASYDDSESEEEDDSDGDEEDEDDLEEVPLDNDTDIPLVESNSDSFAPVDEHAFEESSNLNPPEEGNFEVLSPTKPLQRARTQIGSVEVSLHANGENDEAGMKMTPSSLNLHVKEEDEDEDVVTEEADLHRLETAVSSTDSESTGAESEQEEDETDGNDDEAKVLVAEEREIEGVAEEDTPKQERDKSLMTEEEIKNVQEMAKKLIKRKNQIHVPLPIGKSHSEIAYRPSRSGSSKPSGLHIRNASDLSAIKMKNNDTLSTASSSYHDVQNPGSPSMRDHSPTGALSTGSSSPLRSVYSDDESDSSEGYEDGSRGALFDDEDESNISPRGRTSLGSSYIQGPGSPDSADSYFSDNDEDLFEILGNEFMYMTSCGVDRQGQRRKPAKAAPTPRNETFLTQLFQFGGSR